MKLSRHTIFLAAGSLAQSGLLHAEPRLDSWLTTYSTQYARIYQTDAAKLSGTTVTTWANGSQNQNLPTYCGVQELSYSDNWVYFRSSGLGGHVMGPWYNNAARTVAFVNLPANQRVLYRVPLTPVIPAAKTLIGGGTVGYTVDGVSVFDGRDAFYWNGTMERMGVGVNGAFWWRDAYPNESVTFDPAAAHQQNTGVYHYHASPLALRYLLGDHVDFNPTTKTYTESTSLATAHSPILGWARDGLPIYGPYGYSSPTDPNSAIRRMVSGYVLRNGQNGTDNLASTGRTSLPAWALRAHNATSGPTGPAVSTTYLLGRYTEDYAYLGDLTNPSTGQPFQLGVDFDLNEYNVRFGVTPEFPEGTWAYFNTISATGAPAYPYNLGRNYFGAPAGGPVTTITESVTIHFRGGPATQEMMTGMSLDQSNGNVTVVWSSVEGGNYRVETSADLAGWATLNASQPAARGIETPLTEASAAATNARRLYRVTRTSLANYDSVVPN